ncbi:hypothetical protein P154DRAFT_314403 [Amniculicola lignicola CBS 123094]|uniref:Uncharacterized protein n=1 Tax=Amniculicola lignicola CBS 123094 TaxID=1392246 RepID=A0A6A5WV65_9PLEO|nr:hypothetical protein P154DRAFT_314403 [Amniculicola lignicola CBS 123094]
MSRTIPRIPSFNFPSTNHNIIAADLSLETSHCLRPPGNQVCSQFPALLQCNNHKRQNPRKLVEHPTSNVFVFVFTAMFHTIVYPNQPVTAPSHRFHLPRCDSPRMLILCDGICGLESKPSTSMHDEAQVQYRGGYGHVRSPDADTSTGSGCECQEDDPGSSGTSDSPHYRLKRVF